MLTAQDRKNFLQSLFEFLRIRSVSSDPACQPEMLRAVSFLKKELRNAGFKKVEVLGKPRPVVYAEKLDNPQAPTVLIYGHYDIQPADPLALWKTPPFSPTVRQGKIYARGATDDKGQLYTHLAALNLLSRGWGSKWPINVKVLIEGEEETSGQTLEKLIRKSPKKFAADLCLVSDTGFISKREPAIEVGLRGIAYFELEIETGKTDLHSGLYGGVVLNPLNLISDLMSRLGKEINTKLREEPENARFPSFDVHGILGGFQGEGSKTVIPNKAKVKFSLRLIPGQKPEERVSFVKNFVKKNTPRGVKTSLRVLGTGQPFLTKENSSYLKSAKQSMKKIFSKSPVLTRSGGSIPIIPVIAEVLKCEVLLMGYGLPDDNLHAPNEKFDLDQFYKGIECNIDFLKNLIK